MDRHHHLTPTCAWSVSLVIPAYNEEATIGQAIDEADRALARIARDYEILVVNDGSCDQTAELVLAAARERPGVRLLQHETNRGYGAALRTGFEAARHDRVAFTDADCQFYLEDLAALVARTEEAPVAVGYRMDRKDPWKRRFYSWGYNTLIRALLGTQVRDCDCALKVFRKDALASLLPATEGFFVNTEILTRASQNGLDVVEVGVRHRPRLGGTSKVSVRDIPRTLRTLLPFWWSKVLFPGGARNEAAVPDDPQPERETSFGMLLLYPLLLLAVAALLFFSRLGCPLQEPEESRYAEIPRQMLETGSYCVPVLHGQPYLDKPPLLYWLVMGCYRLFGVHDWAARIVPGVVGLFTVLVTFAWGLRTLGARAAFFSALILCLSVRFVQLDRLLNMNGLLCLCVIASLAAAHAAVRGSRLRWRWWLFSASLCGLGLLAKGPVALALVALPVLGFQVLDPRVARPRLRGWLGYCGVAVGVAAPWYVAISTRVPNFLDHFFWKHQVVRFVVPFDHEEPVWFFLPGLLLGMLPWSLLMIPLTRFLLDRSKEASAERPPALGFFLLSCLWCLAFFSLAGCKRAGYILPAMPPLALSLGCFLDVTLLGQARWPLAWPATAALASWGYRLTGLVLAAGLLGSLLAMSVGLLDPRAGGTLVGLSLLGWIALVVLGTNLRPAAAWATCSLTTFALLLAATHWLLPGYARRFSMRGTIRSQIASGADAHLPVLCYPRRWDSVSFYLQRTDVRVFQRGQKEELFDLLRARPRALLVVKSEHFLDDLLRDLPVSLEFEPRGRRGNVTVGLVRPRLEAPPGLLVRR